MKALYKFTHKVIDVILNFINVNLKIIKLVIIIVSLYQLFQIGALSGIINVVKERLLKDKKRCYGIQDLIKTNMRNLSLI